MKMELPDLNSNIIHEDDEDDDGRSRRRVRCVKVYMEGVAIGRKVDLFRFSSYHELLQTLRQMFPAARSHDLHRHGRSVMYEDGDGIWTAVGGVPWETFIWSAKRLKILC